MRGWTSTFEYSLASSSSFHHSEVIQFVIVFPVLDSSLEISVVILGHSILNIIEPTLKYFKLQAKKPMLNEIVRNKFDEIEAECN